MNNSTLKRKFSINSLFSKNIEKKSFSDITKFALILFLTFETALAQVPVDGLKGYWKLDGNVVDASGNNNNGTLQGGAIYCVDRFGVENSAVKLGGYYNSSAIYIPNSSSLYLNSELTIACWFKLDDPMGMDGSHNYSATCRHNFIAKDGDRSGFCLQYKISPNEQNPTFSIYNNTSCLTTPTFAYEDVQNCINIEWIHVAVVVDNISITMYINGMQKHRETYNTQITFTKANENHLTFGRFGYNCGSNPNYWYPLNGKLDDIVYYNRALSQEEINILYNYPAVYAPPTAMVSDTISDSVYLGEVYEQNGFSLPAQTEPGIHIYSRTNGCDSIWTLILNVIDNDALFYVNNVYYDNLLDTTFCSKDVYFSAEIEGLNSNVGSLKWFINGTEETAAEDQLEWNKSFDAGEYEIKMWVLFDNGDTKTITGTLKRKDLWIKMRNVKH